MMEAKDTVMDEKDARKKEDECYQIWEKQGGNLGQIRRRVLMEAQAEITWAAAIKEVVEFIQHREKNYSHTPWGDAGFRQNIVAQLKEWGIK